MGGLVIIDLTAISSIGQILTETILRLYCMAKTVNWGAGASGGGPVGPGGASWINV